MPWILWTGALSFLPGARPRAHRRAPIFGGEIRIYRNQGSDQASSPFLDTNSGQLQRAHSSFPPTPGCFADYRSFRDMAPKAIPYESS